MHGVFLFLKVRHRFAGAAVSCGPDSLIVKCRGIREIFPQLQENVSREFFYRVEGPRNFPKPQANHRVGGHLGTLWRWTVATHF